MKNPTGAIVDIAKAAQDSGQNNVLIAAVVVFALMMLAVIIFIVRTYVRQTERSITLYEDRAKGRDEMHRLETSQLRDTFEQSIKEIVHSNSENMRAVSDKLQLVGESMEGFTHRLTRVEAHLGLPGPPHPTQEVTREKPRRKARQPRQPVQE